MTVLAIEDYYSAPDDGGSYHFAMQRAQAALGANGGVIEFTRQNLYTFTAPVPLTGRVWLRGNESAQTTESTSQLRFVSCAGFHVVYPGHPDYPETLNGEVGISHLMVFRQGGPTQELDHHGIQVDRKMWMEHVSVYAFPGYGIVSDTSHGRSPPTAANCCAFYNVRVYNAGRSGWLFRGSDSNGSSLIRCHADLCGMRRIAGDNHGFYEDSLIGNAYFACHSDLGGANPGGRTYYAVRPSNGSTFHGCYAEAATSEVTGSCIIFGGTMGPATGVRQTGILHNAPPLISDHMQHTLGPAGVKARYARYGTDEISHWTSTEDPVGLKWQWSPFHKSWISLHSGATVLVGLGVTGAPHPRGKGLAHAPRGFLVGTVRHGGGTAPPTVQPAAPDAAWKPGDIFWHADSTAPERWRCLAADPDGTLTWDPIG